jgi:hypothetical protein
LAKIIHLGPGRLHLYLEGLLDQKKEKGILTFRVGNTDFIKGYLNLKKLCIIVRGAMFNFLEIPLSDDQNEWLSAGLKNPDEFYCDWPPSIKVHYTVKHTDIYIEFADALFLPNAVARMETQGVSMFQNLSSFLAACAEVQLPPVLQPSASRSIVPITPEGQIQPGGITPIGAQTRRDAFEYFAEQLPYIRRQKKKWKETFVYTRYTEIRKEAFKLTRHITLTDKKDEGEWVRENERSSYVLRRNEIEGEKEGRLYIEVNFVKNKPEELHVGILYNLLTADEMRGAAREMLCYVLTTIMHEKPWEEHGVETAPHLLTLFAFGGGPQSFSTEASPESIRRLVRYYRKLGFVRTSLSIAMLPRVFLGIQPMGDQKSFVLRIFNQDGESDYGDESEPLLVDVVLVHNVSQEVIDQFRGLAEED